MKSLLKSLIAGAAVLCTVMSPLVANAADKPLSQADVEAIVKKVLEDNPELIIKSVETYQIKQRAASVAKASQNIVAMKGDLENNPNSPSVGNPTGDVAVIEFFDYHCHYCKQFYPSISKLIDDDKNVRVVFKEFPILSEDSVLAAKAALAVNSIDKTKYFAYHTALMKSSGAFTMDMLSDTAKSVGIDPAAFKKAMEDPNLDKEIQHNKDLAQSLNISGTPAIIVGGQLVPGAIDIQALKDKVAEARAAAKK